MNAQLVEASLPQGAKLLLAATNVRPCALEIECQYRRDYRGEVERCFIGELLLEASSATKKYAKKAGYQPSMRSLCFAVGDRARVNLRYDRDLWIGSTMFRLAEDEVARVEQAFASHGLEIERKEDAT